MRRLTMVVMGLLLLTGCGRKEPPQPLTDQTAPPSIASMQTEQAYNSLKLTMHLAGGGGLLGYQIDRAQIDPFCHCPTPWRRDYEMQPKKAMDQGEVIRLITVRTGNVEFLYRIRAVDALGRLGSWSKPMHIKVIPK
ncbi:MAG: hypothetical protein R8J84_02495 [Mariprofundales bacterium]